MLSKVASFTSGSCERPLVFVVRVSGERNLHFRHLKPREKGTLLRIKNKRARQSWLNLACQKSFLGSGKEINENLGEKTKIKRPQAATLSSSKAIGGQNSSGTSSEIATEAGDSLLSCDSNSYKECLLSSQTIKLRLTRDSQLHLGASQVGFYEQRNASSCLSCSLSLSRSQNEMKNMQIASSKVLLSKEVDETLAGLVERHFELLRSNKLAWNQICRRQLHSSSKSSFYESSVSMNKTQGLGIETVRLKGAERGVRRGILLGRHVQEALANGEPVVALESTVITHGLPEPENLKLALSLEEIVRGINFFGDNFIVEPFHPKASNNYDDDGDHNHHDGFKRKMFPRNREERKDEVGEGETSKSYWLANERSLSESNNNNKNNNDDYINTFRYNSDDDANDGHQSSYRSNLVIPATVGIVKGQLVVGLSREEIEYLASARQSSAIKASRRDIPIAMALKLSAGTTVSGTMAIVNSLPDKPIKVFATGGTGGVHKGGELSMDVSADLYEFARSPMGVVSSGFKSFLDTRRSLEFLETLGCPVVSLKLGKLAQNDDDDDDSNTSLEDNLFPAFFCTSDSQNKIKSPRVLRSLEEAARVLYFCLEASPLENRRAMLLANPIPQKYSLDSYFGNKKHNQQLTNTKNAIYNSSNVSHTSKAGGCGVDKLIDKDLGDCSMSLEESIANISEQIDKRLDLEGKEKTPLILERLNVITNGRSLKANIILLKNNAYVGSQLALEYAKLSAGRVGSIRLVDEYRNSGEFSLT